VIAGSQADAAERQAARPVPPHRSSWLPVGAARGPGHGCRRPTEARPELLGHDLDHGSGAAVLGGPTRRGPRLAPALRGSCDAGVSSAPPFGCALLVKARQPLAVRAPLLGGLRDIRAPRMAETIWAARLGISPATAHKISRDHGLQADEVRDAVVCVRGLRFVLDDDPIRGRRALVRPSYEESGSWWCCIPRTTH
jgi:hypothetical protein